MALSSRAVHEACQILKKLELSNGVGRGIDDNTTRLFENCTYFIGRKADDGYENVFAILPKEKINQDLIDKWVEANRRENRNFSNTTMFYYNEEFEVFIIGWF